MFRVHKETPEGNAKREHFSKVTTSLSLDETFGNTL